MKRTVLVTTIMALAGAVLLASAPSARADLGFSPAPYVLRANIIGAGVSGTAMGLVRWQWAYSLGKRPTTVTVTALCKEGVNILAAPVTLNGQVTDYTFPVYGHTGWGCYSITFHAVWVNGSTVVHRYYYFQNAYIG